MAQSVVPQKAEKAEKIICMMKNINDENEFKELFKMNFPNDWGRIKTKYAEEERKDKKRKGHPMPHPDKYLHNMYRVAIRKH